MDSTAIKFILVGIINTLFGTAIMFGLYNLAGCSYWVSSAANYFFGSILSFVLNKRFTFQNRDSIGKTAPKFILNILVCYLLAYGIAKPAALWICSGLSQQLAENVAMGIGMVLFTGLNYIGQRFFAFKTR
jgi:putative flippase GtrA